MARNADPNALGQRSLASGQKLARAVDEQPRFGFAAKFPYRLLVVGHERGEILARRAALELQREQEGANAEGVDCRFVDERLRGPEAGELVARDRAWRLLDGGTLGSADLGNVAVASSVCRNSGSTPIFAALTRSSSPVFDGSIRISIVRSRPRRFFPRERISSRPFSVFANRAVPAIGPFLQLRRHCSGQCIVRRASGRREAFVAREPLAIVAKPGRRRMRDHRPFVKLE